MTSPAAPVQPSTSPLVQQLQEIAATAQQHLLRFDDLEQRLDRLDQHLDLLADYTRDQTPSSGDSL